MMNILLVNVPSYGRAGVGMVPMGLLYAGATIERSGHTGRIFDPYVDDDGLEDFDSDHFEKIDKIIDEFKPRVVGYGGIATSYGRTKKVSRHIRRSYPGITQIAGGALSSTSDLLLVNADLDLVFHGEVEVSLPIFLESLDRQQPTNSVPGTSYRDGGIVVRNKPAEQVPDLDTIPFPAYHLVDVTRYQHPIRDYLAHYESLIKENAAYSTLAKTVGTKTHDFPMFASRGCTHRCSFCYRHFRGIRRHSVDYVIRHMKYLNETYGISGFQFCDELFNSSYEWVLELCAAIEKNHLDIYYMVAGARADKVDEVMLRRLKETGCVEIDYGVESGSDAILKEYRKGITAQRNREVILLTRKIGLVTVVQLVIGSPAETTSTIGETVRFLEDLEEYQYCLHYLIPLPETPIWRYVQENKLIPDVEKYLDRVAMSGGIPLVNLTREPDQTWQLWSHEINSELRRHYYQNKTKRSERD